FGAQGRRGSRVELYVRLHGVDRDLEVPQDGARLADRNRVGPSDAGADGDELGVDPCVAHANPARPHAREVDDALRLLAVASACPPAELPARIRLSLGDDETGLEPAQKTGAEGERATGAVAALAVVQDMCELHLTPAEDPDPDLVLLPRRRDPG